MLSKLKNLNEMRKQASQIQNQLATEKIEVNDKGNQIIMNANMEILKITINEQLDKVEKEKILKNMFNEAVKKAQRIMANKMMRNGFSL